ncbi:MAG TPA: DUF2339 domain-containing protein [Thermoanaerobaculia bacterium]|jgi:hypothetical protein
MVTFIALVVAVVALVVASKARREVEELRALVAGSRSPAVRDVRPGPAPAENLHPAADNVTPPPPPPAFVPPAPPPAPKPIPTYTAPPKPAINIDWENLVGIKLFSWIAGIALVLAAVFLFKYSVEHGWLRPAIRATFGLLTGIGLLVACELRIARNYRFTANAMDGAGIAILYATLFALHDRWNLWPAWAAFLGMLVVTAAAVYLSTRRDSVFIALLGLIGGFATPALLSSGENRPIELFSYLLLLNGGIAWIAYRKRWPLLTGLSVVLTAIYQWAWIERFLTTGQLPLAAAVFLLFAAVGASSLWPRADDDRGPVFRRIAAAGAVLPLLFAFFTAIVPEYGARYNVLFGFLLLITSGLAAIALWRGPEWLHALGGAATLLTFFIWLIVSYSPVAWPWILVWLAAFIVLYLAADLNRHSVAGYTAPLLFFVFIGLALRGAPQHALVLTGALFALLTIVVVYALNGAKPYIATTAIAFASVAVMTTLDLTAPLVTTAHAVLLITFLGVLWVSDRHELALVAIPFSAVAHLVSERYPAPQQFVFGVILYAIFLAYPFLLGSRVRERIAPHLAAVAASAIFFLHVLALRTALGFESYAGVLPFAQALLMLGLMIPLLRLEPQPRRLAMLGAAALAFLTIAVPVQLDDEWIAIAWAVEAAALAWLYMRVAHRGIALWSGGLAAFVLGMLIVDPVFDGYQFTYPICAAAMFFAAYRTPVLRNLAASFGTIELFMLLNVAIHNHYASASASSLARDLTYTIAWALFAIAVLVAGIVLGSRAARVSALALLLVTVLKCFLHDLASLGGLYRVASLFGLAVSLVLVGLMLQKFVIMRRATPPAPDATA